VEFENTFTVKAPVDEVYEALLDLERVTPAMPGAKVLEKTGDDSYKVAIKVKLGPVSMTYRGDVKVVEQDPAAHSAVLDVKAREARGQGSANATVTTSLAEEGSETRGTLVANVQLSGKAAAMSRGVIDDVSKRLVATFAQNLEGIVGAPEAAQAGEPRAAAPPPAPPGDDAVSVGPLAAGIAADRIRDPRVLAGIVGGALLVGWLVGRRS
jgi:carbon monoxide dehydrogenase subunit G